MSRDFEAILSSDLHAGGHIATPSSTQQTRLPLFAITIALALTAMYVINSEDRLPGIAVIAVIGIVLAFRGIRYALDNPSWFIFALVMEEVLPYLNVIPLDPTKRWFLRYPLLLPLTIPALWQVFRSGGIWRKYYKTIMVFWAWALVSVTYSLNPAVSFGRLIPNVLLFGTVVAVADRVNNAEDVQVVLGRFVLGCGLVQILDGIAYFFLPPILGGAQDALRATWMIDPLGQDLPRFAGVFNNPNAVGGVMMATVTASVAHWHAVKSRHRKILMALSMASAVFFALVADSRSETAATIVGCTTYALWKYRWRAVRVLAVIVVAALLTLPFINKQYLNRGLDTATGRTEAWAFEVRAVKASPFIGYGFQVEGEIFQNRYWTNWQDFWDHGANTALHNGYMSTAIGLGIPALLLWLVAFVTPWVMLLRDETDAWNLKPLLCLVALPILLISFDESIIEVRAVLGLLVWVSWAITAHYGQIVSSAQTIPRKSLKAEWIPIFRLPHAENFR